jgi:addiction module HigA family antidote
MIPKNRMPTHPGEFLLEEFLKPLCISQAELARQLGDHLPKINAIIKGKRGLSPDMCWKLSKFFGNSVEFWGQAQLAYDLAAAPARHALKQIKPWPRPDLEDAPAARKAG